jgi:hypothetical protein
MEQQKKGSAKIWNIFLSNLCKHFCESASFGLRSLKKVDMNGMRLVWKLEFDLENWIFEWKPSSFFIVNVVWTIYNFWTSKFDRIIKHFIIGCFAGLLVR